MSYGLNVEMHKQVSVFVFFCPSVCVCLRLIVRCWDKARCWLHSDLECHAARSGWDDK